jgi:hypothetical protein
MTGMRSRVLIALPGVAAAAYGVVLLLRNGLADLVSTAVWLASGVVLHDFVLVPVTLAVCWLGLRLVPTGRRAPVAAGLLVLGSLTIVAMPVLGRFGARSDNATLLDRNYTVGWLVVAALTVVAVVVGVLLSDRRARGRRTGGPGTRGR